MIYLSTASALGQVALALEVCPPDRRNICTADGPNYFCCTTGCSSGCRKVETSTAACPAERPRVCGADGTNYFCCVTGCDTGCQPYRLVDCDGKRIACAKAIPAEACCPSVPGPGPGPGPGKKGLAVAAVAIVGLGITYAILRGGRR